MLSKKQDLRSSRAGHQLQNGIQIQFQHNLMATICRSRGGIESWSSVLPSLNMQWEATPSRAAMTHQCPCKQYHM